MRVECQDFQQLMWKIKCEDTESLKGLFTKWRCLHRRQGWNCTWRAPLSIFQCLSSPSIIHAVSFCLGSKFSLLIRETFSQANFFVRINTFLTFRWILNVWFLRSAIQNPQPQAQPDVNETWIVAFKAWNWCWYLKTENDTQASSPV